MSIPTRRYRTAAITTVAAIVSVVLTATPASAQPSPEPADPPVSAWNCPTRIDTVSQMLRAEGFAAQAAKNIAAIVHRECL